LEVKLLGSFALRRGGVPIPTEAWQRPGVRQLFHYFSIHHGVRLTRAQILQDLWPDSSPERGLAAFRTSFSRLGNVLEPYLRRRTAMRYFEVVGDRYIFDPQLTLVAIDSEELTRSVQAARRQDAQLDETQLNALLEILDTWDSPLTEVAYAAWAVHTIEDLKERFAAGCLLVARDFLARERLAEATTWAEKGLAVAPWNEECWQTLILCAARQGQRSLALKHYEQAVHTLESELGAPPSPATVRLVERLRRNETI
jgi:DNA-binding SARP family transcriptional activator